MSNGLYLGKTFDPAAKSTGEQFLADPADLTTHGLVVGMTGSGKTGLSIVLIEECLRSGIPAIVIDPKADMTNLALAFKDLSPAEFQPWVDSVAAQRDNKTPEQAAADAAALWSKGLADWGIGQPDVAAYVAGHDLRIITPGSSAGIPLNLIDRLDPPEGKFEDDEEDSRDQIDGIVSALLGLADIKSDPVNGREYIFLFSVIENAWRAGQGLTLETLIGQVASPPFDKMGALPIETVYPQADRTKLMMALNNLLASPPFAAWRTGEPIDVGSWLHTADGRPRLTVIYTAHLEDEQRIFVTALVLNRIKSWMRTQPGTGELRCLLYMDEIFGYFPPTQNPPTKKPLLTLLKQARAFGVGVLLATQNPVDLDYKALSNMGFWAIGRLQTSQDQARVKEGVEAALADSGLGFDFDSMIAGVEKRVFLIHDVHRKAPALVESRWAMSYLRGPLTKDEITRVQPPEPAAAEAAGPVAAGGSTAPVATPAGQPTPVAAPISVAPILPAPLKARYLNLHGGNVANPFVFVKASVRYKVGSSATDESTHQMAFAIPGGTTFLEALQVQPEDVDESKIEDSTTATLSYADLPSYVGADGAKGIERGLKDRLDDCLALTLYYDQDSKLLSQPGEDVAAFAARVGNSPASAQDRAALQQKLDTKQRTLEQRQAEAKSRKAEKWTSIGTSVVSNVLGMLGGRKRSVTGLSGVLSKNRMENTAESRVDQLEADVASLKQQLDALGQVDASRFEQRLIKPAKTDVSLIRYDVLWVY